MSLLTGGDSTGKAIPPNSPPPSPARPPRPAAAPSPPKPSAPARPPKEDAAAPNPPTSPAPPSRPPNPYPAAPKPIPNPAGPNPVAAAAALPPPPSCPVRAAKEGSVAPTAAAAAAEAEAGDDPVGGDDRAGTAAFIVAPPELVDSTEEAIHHSSNDSNSNSNDNNNNNNNNNSNSNDNDDKVHYFNCPQGHQLQLYVHGIAGSSGETNSDDDDDDDNNNNNNLIGCYDNCDICKDQITVGSYYIVYLSSPSSGFCYKKCCTKCENTDYYICDICNTHIIDAKFYGCHKNTCSNNIDICSRCIQQRIKKSQSEIDSVFSSSFSSSSPFKISRRKNNNNNNDDDNDSKSNHEEEEAEGAETTTTTTSRNNNNNIVKLNCPGGHGLQHFDGAALEITTSGITSALFCDLCGNELNSISYYGCRICDIDVCESCISNGATQADIDKIVLSWMEKVQKFPYDALEDAPYYICNNRNIILSAVQKQGYSLVFASPKLQNDKRIVMAAVHNDGRALGYASPRLQRDKQVVLIAVQRMPDSIKYAHGDIKHDPDVLIAAGMYDPEHDDASVRRQQQHGESKNTTTTTRNRKIVFSTRYSLSPTSYSQATKFTTLFKNSEYIKKTKEEGSNNFIVYAPNAFDKQTCDPNWTDFDWPCRGTKDTCRYNNILTKDGHPTNDCCWRYSFKSQLEEAKATGGFMLQLVETGQRMGKIQNAKLGNGQKIELDMSKQIGGIKVFQVYCPTFTFYGGEVYEKPFIASDIDTVTNEISKWYNEDQERCQDDDDDDDDAISVTIIHPWPKKITTKQI